jgi:hypothetical protein
MAGESCQALRFLALALETQAFPCEMFAGSGDAKHPSTPVGALASVSRETARSTRCRPCSRQERGPCHKGRLREKSSRSSYCQAPNHGQTSFGPFMPQWQPSFSGFACGCTKGLADFYEAVDQMMIHAWLGTDNPSCSFRIAGRPLLRESIFGLLPSVPTAGTANLSMAILPHTW